MVSQFDKKFLIIFDCDGVLVDSEIIATQVNLELIKKLGLDLTIDEFSEKYSGLTGHKIFEEVATALQIPYPRDTLVQSERHLDKALKQNLKAIEGVDDMLDQLEDPWCICSNSTTQRIRQNLEKTGLYNRFKSYIYSAKEVRQGYPKPAPDVFLHAAETLNIDPHNTVVIEDSIHGVEGAIAAGMRVIGFIGGSHSYPGHGEKLMEKGAETTVRRLVDIPATIAALKTWSHDLA